MSKHTPGPWYTRKNDASITAQLLNGTAFSVAHVDFSKSRDEWVANARLIAAAPDMLAALENLVNKYNAMQDGNISAQLTNGDFFSARAAIAKAKGESE